MPIKRSPIPKHGDTKAKLAKKKLRGNPYKKLSFVLTIDARIMQRVASLNPNIEMAETLRSRAKVLLQIAKEARNADKAANA